MRALSCRLEEETGIHMRFAIGAVPEQHRQAISEEEAQHGSFLRIPVQVRRLRMHPAMTVPLLCQGLLEPGLSTSLSAGHSTCAWVKGPTRRHLMLSGAARRALQL
jgi:hypothetical protein